MGHPHEIRTKLDWSKRRVHIIENMQKAMGPLPRERRPTPEVVVLEETRLPKYVRKRIAYLSEKQDRVPAFLLIPLQGGKLPAVLCLHQTTRIGKEEPAGMGGNPNLAYAAELAERLRQRNGTSEPSRIWFIRPTTRSS